MGAISRCNTRLSSSFQDEKEALDDLAMELELADEDEDVLCVKSGSYVNLSDLSFPLQVQNRGDFCSYATRTRSNAATERPETA